MRKPSLRVLLHIVNALLGLSIPNSVSSLFVKWLFLSLWFFILFGHRVICPSIAASSHPPSRMHICVHSHSHTVLCSSGASWIPLKPIHVLYRITSWELVENSGKVGPLIGSSGTWKLPNQYNLLVFHGKHFIFYLHIEVHQYPILCFYFLS